MLSPLGNSESTFNCRPSVSSNASSRGLHCGAAWWSHGGVPRLLRGPCWMTSQRMGREGNRGPLGHLLRILTLLALPHDPLILALSVIGLQGSVPTFPKHHRSEHFRFLPITEAYSLYVSLSEENLHKANLATPSGVVIFLGLRHPDKHAPFLAALGSTCGCCTDISEYCPFDKLENEKPRRTSATVRCPGLEHLRLIGRIMGKYMLQGETW